MAHSSSLPRPAYQRRRKRVALLVSYLSNEYEWSIVRGVRAAVEASGATVLCVAGGALFDPKVERSLRNGVFELLDSSNVDGVIAISNVIGQFVGREAMGQWLRRFQVPLCSIGHIDGVPSVEIDDLDGVTQLMRHLIEYHGYRKIAFIA